MVGLLAWGCGGDAAEIGPTALVERTTIERIVVATGTIEPAREVEVRPRIPGIVEKILVDPGDDVKPGQVLIEIERDLLASEVREAEAVLQDTKIERRYARIDLDRLEELERGGATSQKNFDAARSRHERAAAQVARAEARLDTLSTQLGYATVTSPLMGRVLDVHIEEGSAVSPVTAVTGGSLLISLAATDTLHLEGLVDENEVVRVELGQSARIRTEAFGDRIFRGRVTEIALLGQRIENVTYFEVEIEIEDEGAALLRPRMSGDADLITEVVTDAIVMPETALRYRGERIFAARVLRDGGEPSVEEIDVEIGIVDGSRVQILSGLSEGDEVLLQ
jgi:HlyD family secretion protein